VEQWYRNQDFFSQLRWSKIQAYCGIGLAWA
jgi:hypothetical protein